MRPAARSAVLFALVLSGALAALALDPAKLRAAYLGFVADAPPARFSTWLELVAAVRRAAAAEQVERVNEFFNARLRFVDDTVLYGLADYWATPMETLARAAGDCEDYAIAKYFTLVGAGVPVQKLRLTYVRARIGAAYQAHMVLAYYEHPDAEPLIMDNLVPAPMPASRRPDLLPVFNFNSEGVDEIGPGRKASHSISRLSRWQDTLKRARDEGFD